MAKYLVLQHIYDHKPITVVQGAYLDPNDSSHWIAVKDTSVPDGTVIKAGSIVQMELAQWRAKRSEKNGVLTPIESLDGFHFNLESLFGNDMVDHLDSKPALVTDVLHEYGIFTLEHIASEKPGIVPFTPQNTDPTPLALSVILGSLCENDKKQVETWIRTAKKLILEPVVAPVEPVVTKPETKEAVIKPAKG